MATDAMRNGAIDFLPKPYNNEQFLRRVRQELAAHERQWLARERMRCLATPFGALTGAKMNCSNWRSQDRATRKSRALDISVKTVEARRARLTRKRDVHSLAELVQLTIEFKRHRDLDAVSVA